LWFYVLVALLFHSNLGLAQSTAGPKSVDLSSPEVAAAGEKVFAVNCSVGYCHGKAGRAGRGPRLRGRSWDKQFLFDVILNGIPSSSMPAWKDRLTEKEIWQTVAYIMTLSKLTSDVADASEPGEASAPAPEQKEASTSKPSEIVQHATSSIGDAERGKNLFFDSSNDLNCGSCHRVRGVGNPIGPDLSRLQERKASQILKDIVLPSSTIAPGGELLKITLQSGEEVEGLKVEENNSQLKLYDIGSPPPVLRTIPKAQIQKRETEKRSGMPANYGETYTLKQLLDLIAFLKSGNDPASVVTLQDLF
jgi:putative heme-binding domain-containing protein